MANPIDDVFLSSDHLKIMTHVVAGYPDRETNKRLIKMMAESGVDMVEIQIPFSDPLADGPTIMAANQHALQSGITPGDCFDLAKELKAEVDIPLLFMTYFNIPFHVGMEKFIARSVDSGISGLIIPDIPFDEEGENYLQLSKNYRIHPIQVVSPDVEAERLKKITQLADGFIYTTLKVGITGVRKKIDDKGLAFINTIRKYTSLPLAAGFGISSAEHFKQLQGKADVAVIGSHIINLIDNHGIEEVRAFVRQCKAIL